MNRFILALPSTVAFLALGPLFAVVTVAFSKAAFSTGVPPVMHSEAFAFLVFDGITVAAACFAVAMVTLILDEVVS
jgi:hypothetical protein